MHAPFLISSVRSDASAAGTLPLLAGTDSPDTGRIASEASDSRTLSRTR